MVEDRITSPKNRIVRRYQDAAHGVADGVMVADGSMPVLEGLRAGLRALHVLVADGFERHAQADAVAAALEAHGVTPTRCTDDVLAKASSSTTPQGIAAVFERPSWRREDLLGDARRPALIVVVAGVRDPGNVGAIVRTAEAAGATGVVTLAGGADPFRDKAVRGSAGSIFRLPVLRGEDPAAIAAWLPNVGVALVLAEARADTLLWDLDGRGALALVVGAETAGVPAPLRAGQRVQVPMAGGAESLNVAVAAGVLLYEVARQRRGERR